MTSHHCRNFVAKLCSYGCIVAVATLCVLGATKLDDIIHNRFFADRDSQSTAIAEAVWQCPLRPQVASPEEVRASQQAVAQLAVREMNGYRDSLLGSINLAEEAILKALSVKTTAPPAKPCPSCPGGCASSGNCRCGGCPCGCARKP